MNLPRKQPSRPTVPPDVDPLAEAEVYLAYGRREPAIEILKDALRANPARQDIRKRLAEIAAGKDLSETAVRSKQNASTILERQVAYLLAICFLVVVAIHIAGLKLGFRFEFDYGPLSTDIPRIVVVDPLSWEGVWSQAQGDILWILVVFVVFLVVTIAANRRGRWRP
jgi:hypothetical protein